MTDRTYLNVLSEFEPTGLMRPRAIIWTNGQVFIIDRIKEYTPPADFPEGEQRECYTVEIKGKNRLLYFEKNPDLLDTRTGRWFVERHL